jgi:hypothetical protein
MAQTVKIDLSDEDEKIIGYFTDDIAKEVKRRVRAFIDQKTYRVIDDLSDKNPNKMSDQKKLQWIQENAIPKFAERNNGGV